MTLLTYSKRILTCGGLIIIGITSIACNKRTTFFAEQAALAAQREAEENARAARAAIKKTGNDLLNLIVQGQISRMKKDRNSDTILIEVNRDEYLSAGDRLRINDISISNGATSNKDLGDSIDITKPFPLTVTAENGNKKTYIIKTIYTQKPGNEILQFALQYQDIKKFPTQYKGDSLLVSVDVPWNSSASTNLNVDLLEVSPAATVTPGQGTVHDFSQPVTFTVTSERGEARTYHAYVQYRYQITNGNFTNWHSVSYTSGRAQSGTYDNLGNGWSSYNDGFEQTKEFYTPFPLQKTNHNGKNALLLITRTFQNTGTAWQDFPFGISPGAVFTGSLNDYSRGVVSSSNYKRGTLTPNAIPFGPQDDRIRAKPKSFSFNYQYKPSTNKRKSYNQNCGSYLYWAKWVGNEDCNKDDNKKDSMEVSVLFLNKNDQIVGVGGYRSGESVSTWKTETVTIKYKNEQLNNAESQAVTISGKHWVSNTSSYQETNIRKVQVIITASHGLREGTGNTPIGAAGSELLFDNLLLNY